MPRRVCVLEPECMRTQWDEVLAMHAVDNSVCGWVWVWVYVCVCPCSRLASRACVGNGAGTDRWPHLQLPHDAVYVVDEAKAA